MARSMLWMVFCGLIFTAGISWGQTTPSNWPKNPIRPDTQPDPGNPPPSQPNNLQGNQIPPATQPNNQPNNRYSSDNRYPSQYTPGQPDQPVNPQNPTLERHVPLQPAQPAAPPPPPCRLTPEEQVQVDRMLDTWEKKSREVKTFDSSFVRWEYDLTFPIRDPKAPPNAPPLPNYEDQGILKYAMPDKGVYRIIYTNPEPGKNGPKRWEPPAPERIEHWICDGKSVYEYKYPTDPNDPKKPGQVIEHPLPPAMQGKAIADGPLPFLFGAEANKLRQRYYFRLVTPAKAQNQVWLEAYPKFQQDAANFSRAILVLNLPDMTPKALQTFLPGGKNYNSYEFFDCVTNDPLRVFKGNPFQAYTPRGWQKILEPLPTQPSQPLQATRPLGKAR